MSWCIQSRQTVTRQNAQDGTGTTTYRWVLYPINPSDRTTYPTAQAARCAAMLMIDPQLKGQAPKYLMRHWRAMKRNLGWLRVVRTPPSAPYMAPEQGPEQDVSDRSDNPRDRPTTTPRP